MADPRIASTLVELGAVVGGCRIQKFLGKGGMGEVYLAEHLTLQRPVAVKVLPPSKQSRDHLERFLLEARAASRVEHPNVVAIHDLGNERGQQYIVMQYVEGRNLAEYVREQGGPLPWRSALKVIRLVAKGLGAVHAQNLVHRDLKPANVMLSRDSRVLLMDFGLVRDEARSDLTHTGAILGTPSFMSPEQCRGERVDRRSDLFSLGSTLYFLLTARLPFDGPNVASVMNQIASGKQPANVSQLNSHVPAPISEILRKAMALRPQDRFATAEEFVREVSQVLKRVGGPDQTTVDTSSMSLVRTSENPTPDFRELPELQLLPDGSDTELLPTNPLQEYFPWIVGGSVTVAFLLLGLILRTVIVPPEPAPAVAKLGDIPNSVTSPAKQKTNQMIFIPEGDTWIGDDHARLRRHLSEIQIGDLRVSESDVNNLPGQWRVPEKRRVRVPGFHIDRYEVTNREYREFVAATGHVAPMTWSGNVPPTGDEEKPVTNVDHDDATAYAAWCGKRLPTAIQWQRAYRGDTDQLYPWGDDWRAAASRANVLENSAFKLISAVTATPEDRSSLGVCNLVGNVREILRERTAENAIQIKGTDWNHIGAFGMASATVYFGTGLRDVLGVGFRCVVEKP